VLLDHRRGGTGELQDLIVRTGLQLLLRGGESGRVRADLLCDPGGVERLARLLLDGGELRLLLGRRPVRQVDVELLGGGRGECGTDQGAHRHAP
jgi:hypothetical protein